MAAITILYFAWVREATGVDGETFSLTDEINTPRALAARLAARGGGYAAAFGDPSRLRCAVDQTMQPLDAPLGDAREIAFFPPVTGG